MDTRFSSALHMLILISEAEKPMSSEQIAKSVGTNPSYIRKLSVQLKKAGIIESRQGVTGFKMIIPAEELTLYQIFSAISGDTKIHLFDIHQNPNDKCIVGKHIKPILEGEFSSLESYFAEVMSGRTLGSIIEILRKSV